MLRSREGSVAVLLFLVLPSCSLLIDKNPDGITKDASAGNGTTRSTKSAAGATNGGAALGTAGSTSSGLATNATTNGGALAGGGAAQNGTATLPLGGTDASGGGATASSAMPPGGTSAGATAATGGATGGDPSGGGAVQGGSSTTSVATQCTIASTVYSTGTANPSNACQVCDPSRSAIDWSPGPDGKSCGSNQVCHQGVCSNGCWINSKFYEVGAANPDDSCMYCQSSSPNGWVLASPCVTRVFAHGAISCEILRSGSTLCWGFLVSYDATSIRSKPVSMGLPSSPPVTQISGGGSYSCALSGTDMYCWGYNEEGIYGSGAASSDTPVKTPVTGVLEIASATYVNCVRVGDGVQCAGAGAQAGSFGVLGDGTTSQGRATYEPVSGLTSVTKIAAGSSHACAVSGGSAWCWGQNSAGELGDDSTELRASPVKVRSLANITLLAAGGGHTCAVSAGNVYCWGANLYGQLGNNTATDSHVPVQVVGLDSPVTHLTGGSGHTCAIAAGKLYCWGANDYGQQGDGTKSAHLVATPVPGFSIGVTDVACGAAHTCAIKNGVAYCWGWNWHGQLGNGSTNGTVDDYSAVPVPVFVQR